MKKAIIVFLLLSLIISTITYNPVTASTSSTLNWSSYDLPDNSFNPQCLAYYDGTYLTSDYESIKTSTDLINWTSNTTEECKYISSIARGKDKYVAVGNSGNIITSENGKVWATRKSDIFPLYTVKWINNCYCAAGFLTFLSSSDGINWSKQRIDATIMDICWNGKQYVAVGYIEDEESKQGYIMTSLDAKNWRSYKVEDSSSINSIAWGKENFVALGDNKIILTSRDGTEWDKQAYDSSGYSVFWSGTQYLILGYNYNIKSSEGKKWDTIKHSDFRPKSYTRDSQGYVALDENGNAAVSKDGLVWNLISAISTKGKVRYYNLCYNQKIYAAIGEIPKPSYAYFDEKNKNSNMAVISISHDGKEWENKYINSNILLSDLCWGKGMFIAVGSEGKVLTSYGGNTWNPQKSGVTVDLHNIVWGNNRFVALGKNKTIITSTDGVKWTKVSSLPKEIKQISSINNLVWGNNKFIATCDRGIILSSDGVNWKYNIIDDEGFKFLVFGNKKFVAITNNSTPFFEQCTYVSADGVTWEKGDFKYKSGFYEQNHFFNDAVWGGNGFIAFGMKECTWTNAQSFEEYTYYESFAMVSMNGLSWYNINNLPEDSYNCMLWDGKRYIFMADEKVYMSKS